MTLYVCQRCHHEVNKDDLEYLPGIRCSMCGHRILLKKRPPSVKKLPAI